MADHIIVACGIEYLWRAPIDGWEHDPAPAATCTDALAQGFGNCGDTGAP